MDEGAGHDESLEGRSHCRSLADASRSTLVWGTGRPRAPDVTDLPRAVILHTIMYACAGSEELSYVHTRMSGVSQL